jgi:hypothetical protein
MKSFKQDKNESKLNLNEPVPDYEKAELDFTLTTC